MKSERQLLAIHNILTAKLKSLKRVFIKKGEMMTLFDSITSMYKNNDYSSILKISIALEKSIPHHWSPRYNKYYELIYYCMFLKNYHNRISDLEGLELASEILSNLNLGHELGRAIEKNVMQILKS